MQIGAVFPQTEIGNDPLAIRDYAQTVEGLGFSHLLAYDHVLGASPERLGAWRPYTHESPFHEPFVLFGYLAGVTTTLRFATGIIILPQRQTALVAKQAANVDVLSGGRLRLGVGLGWNEVEYIALNADFHIRGRQIEEQVQVLRALWTQPLINFEGRWHTIPDAGINPLPIQRPIPIWFGGHAEQVLRRVARMGDGWLPNYPTPDKAAASLAQLDQYLAEAGRRRADIGLEARFSYGEGDPAAWLSLMQDWQRAGATHLSVNTMGLGLATPGEHIKALQRFAQEIGIGNW
jgi:probable F420-dependent oxidoreductase